MFDCFNYSKYYNFITKLVLQNDYKRHDLKRIKELFAEIGATDQAISITNLYEHH